MIIYDKPPRGKYTYYHKPSRVFIQSLVSKGITVYIFDNAFGKVAAWQNP